MWLDKHLDAILKTSALVLISIYCVADSHANEIHVLLVDSFAKYTKKSELATRGLLLALEEREMISVHEIPEFFKKGKIKNVSTFLKVVHLKDSTKEYGAKEKQLEKCYTAIKEFRPDIVFANGNLALNLLGRNFKNYGVPIVFFNAYFESRHVKFIHSKSAPGFNITGSFLDPRTNKIQEFAKEETMTLIGDASYENHLLRNYVTSKADNFKFILTDDKKKLVKALKFADGKVGVMPLDNYLESSKEYKNFINEFKPYISKIKFSSNEDIKASGISSFKPLYFISGYNSGKKGLKIILDGHAPDREQIITIS